jgi:hypothetical protein
VPDIRSWNLAGVISGPVTWVWDTRYEHPDYGNSGIAEWLTRIDDGPWTAVPSTTGGTRVVDAPLDHSFDGPHTAELVASDVAGNVNAVSASFTVDTLPPVTTLTPDDGAWHPWSAFRVAATDANGVAATHFSCPAHGSCR